MTHVVAPVGLSQRGIYRFMSMALACEHGQPRQHRSPGSAVSASSQLSQPLGPAISAPCSSPYSLTS